MHTTASKSFLFYEIKIKTVTNSYYNVLTCFITVLSTKKVRISRGGCSSSDEKVFNCVEVGGKHIILTYIFHQ